MFPLPFPVLEALFQGPFLFAHWASLKTYEETFEGSVTEFLPFLTAELIGITIGENEELVPFSGAKTDGPKGLHATIVRPDASFVPFDLETVLAIAKSLR